MIWMIFVIPFLLLFGWILFAPIHILIDTTRRKYGAGILGLITARIVRKDDEGIRIRIKIFFFNIDLNPFKYINKESTSKVSESIIRKRKLQTKEFRFVMFILKTMWKIVKKTKLKKVHLNIDTGDVIKNAYLIPGFVLINTGRWNFSVNYESKFELIIHVEHRLSVILWQIITNFINYKFKKS